MLPFGVRMKSGIALLSLVLALGGATGRATASEPEAPATAARLEVIASSECTSRADLIARVQARAPRARFTDEASAIEVRAEFAVTPAGSVAGSVSLASSGTKTSVRRVLGRNCGDAADAVALIIAVTLDPGAAVREKSAATSQEPPVAPANTNSPTTPSRDAAKPDLVRQHTPSAS